jgi:glycosyltransferase involved in cell wall biosynthesis
VYNGEAYLAGAIESVIQQDYEPIEILVIDDGSTDKTAEIAQSYRDKIRYYCQSNQGPSAARNRGLSLAEGDVITFLDADDLWPRYKLKIQVGYLQARPDLEMVQGLIQRQKLVRNPREEGKQDFVDEWLHPYMNVLLGSMVFRKSAIKKIGCFDATLQISQDTDFWLRVRELGIPFVVLTNLSLLYSLHDNNLTKGKDIKSIEFIQALKRSLDRRRQRTQGRPTSLPKLRYVSIPPLSYLKEKPLVSVIITTHNSGEYLSAALDSVSAQDYEPLDIIVVDDGSGDNTAEIAAGHQEVRYIYQPHQGNHAARNMGLDNAKGDFIAFLDAYDRWTPEKLNSQIEWLLMRPEIDYTLTHMKYQVDSGTDLPAWLEAGFLLREYPGFVWGSFVGRRAVFDKVGDFKAWHQYGEEESWFARARKNAIRMTMLTDTLLHRRVRPENLSFDSLAMKKSLLRLLRLSVRQKHGRR